MIHTFVYYSNQELFKALQCLIVGQKKQDDNVLLVAFAKGDRSAAQQLTERLMPKIYSHAYYRLGNIADAEDVTQEAFLKLWKIAPNWKYDKAQVSTWLYRVVYNLCKDRYRRATLENLSSAQEVTDGLSRQLITLMRNIVKRLFMMQCQYCQKISVLLFSCDILMNFLIQKSLKLWS